MTSTLKTSGTTNSTTMPAGAPRSRSKKAILAGRILNGLTILFLTMDAGVKLLKLKPAIEGTVSLGFPVNTVFGIGLIGLICLIVYVIPRTSIIGAILWTGYLGGAIASKVRIEAPLFSDTLFPIYIAILIWGGLWLRDPRVDSLFSKSASPDR